jgi:hypothetical protein
MIEKYPTKLLILYRARYFRLLCPQLPPPLLLAPQLPPQQLLPQLSPLLHYLIGLEAKDLLPTNIGCSGP